MSSFQMIALAGCGLAELKKDRPSVEAAEKIRFLLDQRLRHVFPACRAVGFGAAKGFRTAHKGVPYCLPIGSSQGCAARARAELKSW